MPYYRRPPRDEIIALFRRRWTYEQIAEHYGVQAIRVGIWLSHYDIQFQRDCGFETTSTLASRLGVSVHRIDYLASMHGLPCFPITKRGRRAFVWSEMVQWFAEPHHRTLLDVSAVPSLDDRIALLRQSPTAHLITLREVLTTLGYSHSYTVGPRLQRMGFGVLVGERYYYRREDIPAIGAYLRARRPLRPWTPEEQAELERRWPTQNAGQIARALGRDREVIYRRAEMSGLPKERSGVRPRSRRAVRRTARQWRHQRLRMVRRQKGAR